MILQSIAAWFGYQPRPAASDASFWSAYGGGENYSGKTVTQQTALQLSAVWGCVRLLAETISTLPLMVYKIDRSGKSSVAYGDALYTILHDAPNDEMTAVDFWEAQLASILLWGNSYALREMTGGTLTALIPLRPEIMAVTRNQAGAIIYRYALPSGIVDYTEDDIFHISGFSLDGIVGLSPIAFARNSMGAAIAIEEAAAVTFSRGMRPGGALTMDQVLKPDQRDQVRDGIMAKFSGAMNGGQTMLLEGGMKYQQITMNPEDAQMLQSRAFAVEELCRWYRVPPFMIGYTEKTTSWGTGLEQQNIGFLTYSLRPYLKRIEQQITRSLIPSNMRATRYAEFNLDGLLRADSAGRAALYASAAQNGWMTRNEIRAKENQPASDAANADALTVQSNLLPLDKLGQSMSAQTPPEPPKP